MKLVAAVVVALALGVSSVATAQVVRSGPTFSLGGTTPQVVSPDVAYDSVNHRWLQVAGNGFIEAHLLDSNGAIIRTFRVNVGSDHAEGAELAFSPDLADGAGGYLVAWHGIINGVRQLRGRLVGADGALLANEFPIAIGGVQQGPSHYKIAYATGSRVFLAAWTDPIEKRVYAQRISLSGGLLAIGQTSTQAWRTDTEAQYPDLAYSARSDRFYLAYASLKPQYSYIASAFIEAGDGEVTMLPSELGAFSNAWLPAVAYSPVNQQFLVTWAIGGQGMEGQLVSEDGVPLGLRERTLSVALAVTQELEFNPHSGEYLAAFTISYGDVWGITIKADGTASGLFSLTNYNEPGIFCDPRIVGLVGASLAVSTVERRWLVVSSFYCGRPPLEDHRYVATYAQFVGSNSSATTPGGAAVLLDYTPGKRLRGHTDTFQWVAGSAATAYWINAGRTQGRYEIYSNYVGAQTSLTLRNLPLDGGPVWLRLMSRVNGTYTFADYRFTAATARAAALVAPAPGSALTSTTATFQWDAGEVVDGFWVNAGTSQGGYNLYSNFVGKNRSLTLSGLPLGGSIWVRLGSLINGAYVWTDYQFSAPRATPAAITAPTPGVQLTSTTHAFHWDAGVGVTAYWLDIGSVQGGAEYWSKYHAQDRYTVVTTLPANGKPLWLRLSSLINGVWTFRDHVYTAPVPALALLTSHHAGSTMAATTVTFTWSAGVGVTAYWLDIGSVRGGSEYYANYQGTWRTRTVSGLPGNGGQLWLRLWSLINGTWTFVDCPLTAWKP